MARTVETLPLSRRSAHTVGRPGWSILIDIVGVDEAKVAASSIE
jgi:hypothetical protein